MSTGDNPPLQEVPEAVVNAFALESCEWVRLPASAGGFGPGPYYMIVCMRCGMVLFTNAHYDANAHGWQTWTGATLRERLGHTRCRL